MNITVGIQLAPMGAWCGSEEKLRVRDGIVVKVNNANGRQISDYHGTQGALQNVFVIRICEMITVVVSNRAEGNIKRINMSGAIRNV
ncbi:hypothetical protein CVS40_6492 [Lucilia cuprina]|nr:hypothetical protein CVS40_6492 [Lucilia cuprina]